MLPVEKSVTFTGACANEIIPSINLSFFYKVKEGRHVRIYSNISLNIEHCHHIEDMIFMASMVVGLNQPYITFTILHT